MGKMAKRPDDSGIAGAPARLPKGSYTIRGHRIVRSINHASDHEASDARLSDSDVAEPLAGKITKKLSGYRHGRTMASSRPNRFKLAAAGLAFGLVGLSAVAMGMPANDASKVAPAATRPVAKDASPQPTDDSANGQKQSPANVLGASDQAPADDQPAPAVSTVVPDRRPNVRPASTPAVLPAAPTAQLPPPTSLPPAVPPAPVSDPEATDTSTPPPDTSNPTSPSPADGAPIAPLPVETPTDQ